MLKKFSFSLKDCGEEDLVGVFILPIRTPCHWLQLISPLVDHLLEAGVGGLLVVGHEGQPGGGEKPLRGAPLRSQARAHHVDQLLLLGEEVAAEILERSHLLLHPLHSPYQFRRVCVVGVGGTELEVKAALDVGEGVAGADERQVHVVHRRVAPISSHDLFGSMEVKAGISSSSHC